MKVRTDTQNALSCAIFAAIILPRTSHTRIKLPTGVSGSHSRRFCCKVFHVSVCGALSVELSLSHCNCVGSSTPSERSLAFALPLFSLLSAHASSLPIAGEAAALRLSSIDPARGERAARAAYLPFLYLDISILKFRCLLTDPRPRWTTRPPDLENEGIDRTDSAVLEVILEHACMSVTSSCMDTNWVPCMSSALPPPCPGTSDRRVRT